MSQPIRTKPLTCADAVSVTFHNATRKDVNGVTQKARFSDGSSNPSTTAAVNSTCAPAESPTPAIRDGSTCRSAACSRTQRMADLASATESYGVEL